MSRPDNYNGSPPGFKKIMTEAGEPSARKEHYESRSNYNFDSKNDGCMTVLIAIIIILIGLIVTISIYY
jgi:hypothetical protein